MNLGEHFTMSEMTRTSTGLDNVPYNVHLVNLTRLVCLVLDPLRKASGRLDVNSGYRSEVVNRELGGSHYSFHTRGLAADIVSERWTPFELMTKLHRMKIPYDKMIAENNGKSQWLHIQLQPVETPNRYERYTGEIIEGDMAYTKL